MMLQWVVGCVLIYTVASQTPVWVNDMNQERVAEDTPPGTIVYTLLATGDPNVKYYIKQNDKFLVNPDSGEVKIRRLLDYETNARLRVTFVAIGSSAVQVERTVTINIIDANDNPPAFEKTTNKATVPEDAPVGYELISDLNVKDEDTANTQISVTCDTQTAIASPFPTVCTLFRLNTIFQSNKNWQGTLTLAGKLDFEQEAYYQMPVVIQDGHYNVSASIEINVANIQDAPPVFIKANDITVMEPVTPNTILDYVSAIDGDVTNPRNIYYEIPAGSDASLFNQFFLNPTNGNISNKVLLDREDPQFVTGVVFFPIKAREILSPGVYGNDSQTTAEATIRIIIQDMNDNAPIFNPVLYNISIPEDIPNRTPLPDLSLSVSDIDLGTNAMYTLTLDNFDQVFEVSPVNGQGATPAILLVKDTNLIDYEKGPRRYEFKVIARESSTTQLLSGTATVIVNVLDVNDNLPSFTQPSYEDSIVESAPGGTQVIRVAAVDPDSGLLGTAGIRYGLIGDGNDLFQIDRVSGQITVAPCSTPGSGNCIDYERKNRYDLTVTARDNDGNGQTVTVNLVIKILDENDNQPRFASKDYTSYIEEKLTRPNPNVTVSATDLDSVGGPVRYSIVSDATGLWQIDSLQGHVTAKQPIFYTDTPANQGFFIITVQATDGKYTDTSNVRIYVIDINDNAPIFELPSYRSRIDEKTAGDTFVLTVKATDKDSPTTGAGVLDYSIMSGSNGKFMINQTTGEIRTSRDATFDFDVQKVYTMEVMARDRGQPPLSATASVIIDIIDANNKNPYFQPSTQRADVYENVVLGFSVYTVKAFDPDDNAVLNYFFSEPIEAITPEGVKVDRTRYDFTQLFKIDQGTGVVRTNSKLDRDAASVVTITMNVVDVSASPQQTGTGTLIVVILEYNDQRPEFLPYQNLTIAEEQPIGSFVVALLAKDDDDPIAEYNLVENPFNFFSIGYQTGVVSINSRIDFESVESTYFKASVWDSGVPRLNNSATVYVTILNINDNSPVFTKAAYDVTLPENTPANTFVVQVQATDKDKGDYGNVRYTLADNRFYINDTTGMIYVANGAVLDRETVGDIDIQVTAYDSPLDATVRRETVVTVYIYLEDINDNPPVFNQREYITTIFETIPIFTEVLQVFASDNDIGNNALLAFQKVPNSGDPEGYFSIDQRSGRIRVSRSLLKKSGTYVFYIEARDEAGFGPFNDTAKVTIIVQEAVNSPPKWIIPPVENTTIYVLEEQYLGMLVYDVKAEDEDSGDNGIVDYGFIQNGQYTTVTPEFKINSITGVIRAQMVYDRETVDKYLLLLVARDRGNPYLETTRYLNVQVLDVNDNPPVFARSSNGETRPYIFDVSENAPVGKDVGRVTATDRDLPQYTRIYYYIISGNERGLFFLNRTTGILYVAKKLDREAQGIYNLDIQATNNVSDYTVITSRRRRALDPSIVTAVVRIDNTNDNPPLFKQDLYHGCISTRSSVGQSIVKVEAEDKDSLGQVTYSMTRAPNTIDTSNILQIDSSSGIITNKVLMDRYAGNTLEVVASATDGQQTATTSVLIFVTEPNSEVKLVINQPASEVRQFYLQIQKQLQELKNDGVSPFKYVCTSNIVDHVLSDGKTTSIRSDMYISAICQGCRGNDARLHHIYTSGELISQLRSLQAEYKDTFDLLYITSMEEATAEKNYLDRTPTLVVMIIVIILIVLALLFLIVACCCIRHKQKEKKKLLEHRISERPIEPVQYDNSFQQLEVANNFNPVYDNRGYVQDEQNMYAKVQKPVVIEERAPQPIPEPEVLATQHIDVVISDDSPASSPPASPKETPRNEDPADEDFRIETEVM